MFSRLSRESTNNCPFFVVKNFQIIKHLCCDLNMESCLIPDEKLQMLLLSGFKDCIFLTLLALSYFKDLKNNV